MDSKPAGRKANLKQYRSIDGRWQFVPVLKVEGRPDPRFVLIDGESRSSKGGTFYLEWREDGKRKTRNVGASSREALAAWRLQAGILSGEEEVPENWGQASPDFETSTTIDAAIKSYLRDVKATKGDATLDSYARDLRWFRTLCAKHYVSRLSRDDAMRLFAAGRDQGLNQKTINKRVIVMLQAMRAGGARIDLRKGDWPKTIDKKVEIYQTEEIKQFFDACDAQERLLFQIFLCTGFRSREVATLSWTNVDWKAGTLSVTPKPELGFKPKSYEERSVPVPRALIATLKAHRESSRSPFLFPTPPHPKRPNYGGDKPDAHALELCKEIAERARLNCRRCRTKQGKCSEGPHCRGWYLHKWRHTFATNMLQSNLDIRSLQILLGHKNLATTEKYLKSLRLGDLRDKIEQSSLAAML